MKQPGPARFVRAVAVVLGATLVAVSASTASACQQHKHSADGLRDLAVRSGVRIGTAVDVSALDSDSTYRSKVAGEFSSVTAENVMKWEVVEPTRGTYDWSQADELVRFARSHGQAVRGHTLLWHSQLPGWLTAGVADGSIDAAELRTILHDHITAEVKHFRGQIYQWDVVNEVFEEDGTLRDTIWLEKLGPSYIADAFRWAHKADPKAKLFMNDYNLELTPAKRTRFLKLCETLLKNGAPLHGIGTQTHLIADIKALIVEVLALEDIRPDEIETDAPLFIEGLGLDSIDALELAMGLEEKYGVIITDDPERNEKIFASVATLADLVTAERTR